ncbi:PucR family transcriptional regulator ligand-binding domain-containing protein [Microbacterium sp. SORGH_AS_0888]|uniref:PucR family transcriptional regulator ligand-binding domain-containing protein n=1 Tax=Microbacterium sp. SORGH_AS_0888 TaxID=3041791 RepID=UPI00277D5434|nr:PucR family transcriptional regulator ligand-binding domain-containing protein [Microbacterium sp. SORGH_AS_0888]MDQ1130753.1 hypothetical protein [Microbacterium sp. SORGH_AS_0888]
MHSSDLADPTPFLTDDLLLLTTGTQFAGADEDAPYRAYVARLRTRGVRGLGFGTEVVRDGIPPALAAACHDERMPLFEVPYRTPFIALARANAEAIAAQSYARRTWALAAQRAISLAALRPDGLGATIGELAGQLEAWVGLFDAAGSLIRSAPAASPGEELLAAVTEEARVVLRRGALAASSLEIAGHRVTMQTLGRGGHLRGVVAIIGPELDLEARSVVTSVVAMTGLALEQGVGLARARSALRSGLLQTLLGDDPQLARRVSRELWGPLPPAPVTVSVATVAPNRMDAAVDWLELRAAEGRGIPFHARSAQGARRRRSRGGRPHVRRARGAARRRRRRLRPDRLRGLLPRSRASPRGTARRRPRHGRALLRRGRARPAREPRLPDRPRDRRRPAGAAARA